MKIRCKINKNRKFKKLCIFLVDFKGNYKGYVDSVYYNAAGNCHISNIWEYPEIMLHGKVVPGAQEFFKAFFMELRKHVKTFMVSVNRKSAIEFLKEQQQFLRIKLIEKTEFETVWAFV